MAVFQENGGGGGRRGRGGGGRAPCAGRALGRGGHRRGGGWGRGAECRAGSRGGAAFPPLRRGFPAKTPSLPTAGGRGGCTVPGLLVLVHVSIDS